MIASTLASCAALMGMALFPVTSRHPVGAERAVVLPEAAGGVALTHLVAGAVGFTVAGPVGGGVGVGAAALGLALRRRLARCDSTALLVESLPAFCALLVRSLRAGRTLSSAIGDAASTLGGSEAETWRAALCLDAEGVGLADRLDLMLEAHRHRDLEAFARAVRLAAEAGGDVTSAIEAVAAATRDDAALAAEATVITTQSRWSVYVLAASPIAFGAVLAIFDPSTARFLLTTPVGLACLLAGTLLDVLGLGWLVALVRGVE